MTRFVIRAALAAAVFVFAAVLSAPLVFRPLSAQDATLRSDADVARAAAFATALAQGLPYVPGEVLVQFRSGVDAVRQASALATVQGAAGRSSSFWLGDTLVVTGLADQDSEHAADVLRRQPEVAFAQPNYVRRPHSIPNDSLYSLQWNMGQINMPLAWDINKGAGSGVIVAVLDSGLTTFTGSATVRLPIPPTGATFGTFAIPFSRPPDFDFTRMTGASEFTPTGPWTIGGQRLIFDSAGHGTHVAGTIAEQTNNAESFAGVAGGVTLMPVKVCVAESDWVLLWGVLGRYPGSLDEGCRDSDIIAGIRYAADNGAKVINISLGGTFPSPALLVPLQYAVSKGAFVAISAGNEALDGNPTTYPASYAATIDGVVAVGATTSRRTRALYSTTGPFVELAAPGGESGCGSDAEGILQIAPDPVAIFSYPYRFDRYVAYRNCGTSMASPHVAGAAALLYSQGITSPAAIESALERFAVDLGTKGRDPDFGFGLIDVRAALLGLGYGR